MSLASIAIGSGNAVAFIVKALVTSFIWRIFEISPVNRERRRAASLADDGMKYID